MEHEICGVVIRHCINIVAAAILKYVLLDFSLSVKAATLIFISGCIHICDSAISSAKEEKSGFIYSLVKS